MRNKQQQYNNHISRCTELVINAHIEMNSHERIKKNKSNKTPGTYVQTSANCSGAREIRDS